MVVGGFDWSFFDSISEILKPALTWAELGWRWFVALQAAYPQVFSFQSLFGLIGTTVGIWKWWEAREANLFARFEEMIERSETKLVGARNDLLDVMIRPGPGISIRAPTFIEGTLRRVLRRRRWTTPFSALRPSTAINRDLAKTIVTCDHKVGAHLARLSLFREQIASTRLIMGALAAGRASKSSQLHQRQRLDQQALDCFRAVLAVPGHGEDVAALELIANQLRRLDGAGQSAIDSYDLVAKLLEAQAPSPARNRALARVKRDSALLLYPTTPGNAQSLLAEASALLTELGPPRDRDQLEYAENLYFEGLARLRLGMKMLGPQRLQLAQGNYQALLRSLKVRERGLFRWMRREARYSGHRVKEMRLSAERGLARTERLLAMNNQHPLLLFESLRKGAGVPRRNRTL
ncbi:MAG: hypothetical protein AB7K67_14545 [Hyphomicrobiaceae bacterium]